MARRLSSYIEGVVDRKVKGLSISLNNSVGFIKTSIAKAKIFADTSDTNAKASAASAQSASTNETNTRSLYNNFTSLYLGVKVQDPQKSDLNLSITLGAFYVRSSDKRLRVAISFNNNIYTWADASVAADPDSVVAIGRGKFLFLNESSNQDVNGPVTFKGLIVVPSVTDWTKTVAPQAANVKKLVDDTKTAIVDDYTAAIKVESDRAKAAESNLNGSATNANQAIADERTRAQGAELSLNTAITAERDRATSAENSLDGKISTNTQAISNEKTRAQTAEQTNAKAVADERTRAQGAELALNNAIGDEKTRAEGAEGVVRQDLQNFMSKFSHGSNSFGKWETRPGILEMWGLVSYSSTSEVTVTTQLPVIAPDNAYTPTVTSAINAAGNNYDIWAQVVLNSRTTSTFSVQYQRDGPSDNRLDGFTWRIIVEIPEGFVVTQNTYSGTPTDYVDNPNPGVNP